MAFKKIFTIRFTARGAAAGLQKAAASQRINQRKYCNRKVQIIRADTVIDRSDRACDPTAKPSCGDVCARDSKARESQSGSYMAACEKDGAREFQRARAEARTHSAKRSPSEGSTSCSTSCAMNATSRPGLGSIVRSPPPADDGIRTRSSPPRSGLQSRYSRTVILRGMSSPAYESSVERHTARREVRGH